MTEFPVIDSHIDTATKILKQNRVFSEHSKIGHCDYPRMREGNVQAALFAIYPVVTIDHLIKGLDL